jgi:phosphonoacetaldehyde hydrolase
MFKRIVGIVNPKSVKAIIFDGAGTIVDPFVFAPTKAFQHLFKQKGITISTGNIRESMGKYKRDHNIDLLNKPLVQQAWKRQYGRDPTHIDIDELNNKFYHTQIETLKKYGKEIHGTSIRLNKMQQMYNLKYGITTGFTRAMLDTILEANPELNKLISSSSTSDEVSKGRPAPYMIYQNLEKLRITDPAEVINVDDTIYGLNSSSYAGCWSVGVAGHSNLIGASLEEPEDFHDLTKQAQENLVDVSMRDLGRANPHFVINDLDQMPKVIEKINQYLNAGFGPKDIKVCEFLLK